MHLFQLVRHEACSKHWAMFTWSYLGVTSDSIHTHSVFAHFSRVRLLQVKLVPKSKLLGTVLVKLILVRQVPKEKFLEIGYSWYFTSQTTASQQWIAFSTNNRVRREHWKWFSMTFQDLSMCVSRTFQDHLCVESNQNVESKRKSVEFRLKNAASKISQNAYTGQKCGNHLVYFPRLFTTFQDLGLILWLSRPGKFEF